MALHRLSSRLRPTVTHVRSLHSGGRRQQQEAVAVDSEPEPFSVFRTPESDPACHSETHIGQYYTLPSAHIRTLFPSGLPWRYQQQVKTFNEACIMVRQPSLEVISYLKKTDYSKPALRYLFYGQKGTGKTISLCHAVHFCYTQGWLVLHIPDAHQWVKNCKELLPSSYNASRFDQPLQATTWLRNFRLTNERFLSKIKTKHRYMWTKREFTEEGSLLGELVDQGISRVKSSSDVVGAVMKELRLQSGQPGSDFHLAVAVDGVNGLWGRSTIKKEDKSAVDPEELTLIYNLRKLMRNDWTGGAIIATLSQTGSLYTPKSAYLPQELLGERGFDSMDPFIPVSVPNYSEKEFESCCLYYMDRHWLQHPQSRTEEGKKELVFLSNKNPSMLDRICGFL
ncbi:small ribosomal subunit protein mS29 [Astatotilapia calliptera]|uniref:Small ribosomal subunit protein mS29 n=3 Tax=Haplochromini TaxID=319058 RepID=A0A3P9CFQ8_9CICH|nr:28S ribosomal protein S29, mitochondrial [Maylandia zebra]XP_004541297.1 28S ribosomal protein S29, mitochondrial [Maylandia zebra]XP_004541298.1 28S ribosomal protein S29, mitochondrial [Maylandia zebra]XP_026041448.1 28S ribosomal protein S29, mitochondrial [Astatotilapia calliptera]XP_026041449.1 28S ribosomal protein S29, mitochondrial [Astatotilapia calliptera]XP_026041450.1 28S ribosomal protein S29, mitochondrial [Astatotilapia calliptera]